MDIPPRAFSDETGTTKERGMHARYILPIVMVVVLISLAGCYESPHVKIYQPGVYKGAKDSLLDKERTPEQQAALRKRFDLVQRDR